MRHPAPPIRILPAFAAAVRVWPVLALTAVSSPALAAPGAIPVQGTLTDNAGVAIDGPVSVTFRLYPDDTATTPVWSNTVTLDVEAGRFATTLGSGEPLDLALFASHPAMHLGIQIDGDTPMPLVPLDHVPYAAWAAEAGDAATLEGVSVADLRSEIPTTADLEAAARGVAYDTEDELTSLLDGLYLPTTYMPDWSELTNRPPELEDGLDTLVTEDELTAALDSYTGGDARILQAFSVSTLAELLSGSLHQGFNARHDGGATHHLQFINEPTRRTVTGIQVYVNEYETFTGTRSVNVTASIRDIATGAVAHTVTVGSLNATSANNYAWHPLTLANDASARTIEPTEFLSVQVNLSGTDGGAGEMDLSLRVAVE